MPVNEYSVPNGTKLSIFDRLRGLTRCRLSGNFADLAGKQATLLTAITLNLVPLYSVPRIYQGE